MEVLLKYWPLVAGIIGIIINIILVIIKIDRHSANLGNKIDLINNTMEKHIGLKISNLQQVQEEHSEKIQQLDSKVNEIDKKVFAHLQLHRK